ncbi:MAG: hydrogenase maturation protease [Candidatus Hadarchaeales archaeon]
MERELREWLSGCERVMVMGIGNPLRRDDAVGLEVVKRMEGKVGGRVELLECESVAENFLEEVERFKPSHLLLLDAALLGLKPGESRLVTSEELPVETVSTHLLPLRIFCDYVREVVGSKVALLCIQPKDTDFGEGMTKELEEAAGRLAGLLSLVLRDLCGKGEGG